MRSEYRYNMGPLNVQTNTTQLRSYCYYVFNFFICHCYPRSKFYVDVFHIPEIHSYTLLLFQIGHICCMCFVRSLRAAVLRQQCSVLPQAEPRPVSDRLPGAFCLWATHAVQQALYGKTLLHERTHVVSHLCTVPCSQWIAVSKGGNMPKKHSAHNRNRIIQTTFRSGHRGHNEGPSPQLTSSVISSLLSLLFAWQHQIKVWYSKTSFVLFWLFHTILVCTTVFK